MRQQKDLIEYIKSLQIRDNWAMGVGYTIPDNMVQTGFLVYFDFLRGVTRKSGEAVKDRSDVATMLARWLDGLRKYLVTFASSNLGWLVQYLGGAAGGSGMSARGMQNLANLALNGFISGVQVTSQRSGAATASIDMSPQMFRGSAMYPKTCGDPVLFKILGANPEIFQQLLTPHIYVYIYAMGRIFGDRYIPIFHGLVNEVELKNDKGIESVSVECEDVSKMLRLTHANISPAIVDVKLPSEIQSRNMNFMGEAFLNQEANQIVGKMICGSNPVEVDGQEFLQEAREMIYANDASAQDGSAGIGILDYLMFENSGEIFNELINASMTKEEIMSFPLDKMRGKRLFIPWGIRTSPYRQLKSPTLPVWDSGLDLKLDVCRAVRNKLYGEFYADAMGNFWLHPMRLGIDFISSGIIDESDFWKDEISLAGCYVLDQDEMITASRSFNDDGICTHLGFAGMYKLFGRQDNNFDLQLGLGLPVAMRERYGMRYQTHVEELVNDRDFLKVAAFAHINLKNADLYNCGLTIPLRPELQIARPILLLDRGEIFYINSVTHSIRVGSIPTTNLGLTFGRSVKAPEFDFISWLIQSGQLVPMDVKEYVNKLEKMAGWKYVMSGEQEKK